MQLTQTKIQANKYFVWSESHWSLWWSMNQVLKKNSKLEVRLINGWNAINRLVVRMVGRSANSIKLLFYQEPYK